MWRIYQEGVWVSKRSTLFKTWSHMKTARDQWGCLRRGQAAGPVSGVGIFPPDKTASDWR